MSARSKVEDDRLEKAMRAASETLAKIEQDERNFYRTYGKHGTDFLNDFGFIKRNQDDISKLFMKKFDQLIADVNAHLKLLENKTRAIPEAISVPGDAGASARGDDENPSSDASSSATDVSTKDDSTRLAEIETELKQLEKRIVNIELRIREDLEAEEIGIAFPIADIIDYVTAIKVAMYKRHLLTYQLYDIVLGDERYAEEAKRMTRDYAVWTTEEREDLLTKLAVLEDSLLRLEQFPLVSDDEFNKYYPLMNDLGFLKRLISRFLDKYEMNSTLPTAKLLPSYSLSRSEKSTVTRSTEEMRAVELQVKSSIGSLKKDTSRPKQKAADAGSAFSTDDEFQPIHEYESEVDIRTAVEKPSSEH